MLSTQNKKKNNVILVSLVNRRKSIKLINEKKKVIAMDTSYFVYLKYLYLLPCYVSTS